MPTLAAFRALSYLLARREEPTLAQLVATLGTRAPRRGYTPLDMTDRYIQPYAFLTDLTTGGYAAKHSSVRDQRLYVYFECSASGASSDGLAPMGAPLGLGRLTLGELVVALCPAGGTTTAPVWVQVDALYYIKNRYNCDHGLE